MLPSDQEVIDAAKDHWLGMFTGSEEPQHKASKPGEWRRATSVAFNPGAEPAHGILDWMHRYDEAILRQCGYDMPTRP